MKVNLLPIINADGKSLSVSDSVDFSERNEVGVSYPAPAKVEAVFTSFGKSIKVCGKVYVLLNLDCDRCGSEFCFPLSFDFEEILEKEFSYDKGGTAEVFGEAENAKNPDVIYYEGNEILLDDIVYNNIFINLPTKRLCKPDCKGLCPSCGKNLNEGDCGCDTRPVDPRFDALDNFFK